MPETLGEKMEWLANEWKSIVSVQLRNGTILFYVMVGCGNQMVPVPQATGLTPDDAIDKAIIRWQNRSEETPFVR